MFPPVNDVRHIQRQYELGQKQGKTLVISRLPSGGTGARRRRRDQCRETTQWEANELTPRGGTRDDEQPRREQPDKQAPRRLLIEAEYEYDFQRVP